MNFSGDPAIIFQQAVREGEKYGAQINGNANNGSFEVNVLGSNYKGTYSVSGSIISIVVLAKPIFIPCGMIETLIKQYLSA